jgi:hypothetical protein
MGLPAAWGSGAVDRPAEIRVLSSSPAMVSDGSALIQVSVPAGTNASDVRVSVDGVDRTSAFEAGDHALVGLVSGLRLGGNRVTAKVRGHLSALTLIDHTRNGPILSGPRQAPFICQTKEFRLPDGSRLGRPQDADCNVPTKVMYVYKAVGGHDFKMLTSTRQMPPDVSKTTTTDGRTVNYVVRVETGTVNRAIYQYAVLFDPTHDPPPSPVASSYGGWNRKIVFAFGGSAAAGYAQGRRIGELNGILKDDGFMISRGFAVLASTLDVLGNAENDVLAAETASLVKEKFIKTFGAPIYTLGWGGSGGSMLQHLIADNYPGIVDGITPAFSFPDLISMVEPADDCSLLTRAFQATSQTWTEAEKTAVSGYGSWAVCGPQGWQYFSPWWMRATQSHTAVSTAFGAPIDNNNCTLALPKALIYDPAANKHGARCDVFSALINEVGINPATGYAARAFDNVGVEYGLKAYRSRAISAEQFLELNEKVGGYDGDGAFQASRTTANSMALTNLYRYGQVNEGPSLRNVPIIDFRINPGRGANVHDSIRSYVMRARLVRANGNANNQVIIRFNAVPPPPGSGAMPDLEPMYVYILMQADRWLTQIAADHRAYSSIAAKVAADKPTDLTSACFPALSERIRMIPERTEGGRCGRLMPVFGDPRLVAGEALTEDVLKCQLKPLRRPAYPRMSGAQFARLKAVFPSGVCDYSKSGVGFEPLRSTWLAYPRPGIGVPVESLH